MDDEEDLLTVEQSLGIINAFIRQREALVGRTDLCEEPPQVRWRREERVMNVRNDNPSVEELRRQAGELSGNDHFSRKERERLQRQIGQLAPTPGSVPAPDSAPAPAPDPPAPDRPPAPASPPPSAPVPDSDGACILLRPDVKAKAKAGRERYWAERRAKKKEDPRPPRKPGRTASRRRPARAKVAPAPASASCPERTTGAPALEGSGRLRDAVQRARGYLLSAARRAFQVLDEALKVGP
jgi:hypothetical protein